MITNWSHLVCVVMVDTFEFLKCAPKDLETLTKMKVDALKDPLAFVRQLEEGVSGVSNGSTLWLLLSDATVLSALSPPPSPPQTLPPIPRPQVVASVPEIDWSKYSSSALPTTDNHHHGNLDQETASSDKPG